MGGRAPRLPAWRYGKRLLWRGYDEWGIVEVVEGFLGRGLHFGTQSLQGRINRKLPWLPVAEYAATMTVAAAFPSPQKRKIGHDDLPGQPHICFLGLGTGALMWTYHHLMPHAKLTAIELRPAVIEVAQKLFRLDELESVHLLVGDAAKRIRELPNNSQTIMLIDLFTSMGIADCLLDLSFWREVARVIHPTGVVCVNTWASRPELFTQVKDCMNQTICPAGELYEIDHPTFSNIILFATPRLVDLNGVLKRGEIIDERLAPPQFRSSSKRRRWHREAEDAGLTGEKISQRIQRISAPWMNW